MDSPSLSVGQTSLQGSYVCLLDDISVSGCLITLIPMKRLMSPITVNLEHFWKVDHKAFKLDFAVERHQGVVQIDQNKLLLAISRSDTETQKT